MISLSLIRACIFFVLSFFLPNRARVILLSLLYLKRLPSSLTIAPCFIDVDVLQLHGENRIGFLTIFRNLKLLHLEIGARIGTFNWIYGSRSIWADELESTLRMKRGSSVTSRHIIDCMGGVEIGEFSLIAGYRSQIISHGINLKQCQQEFERVVVGRYCFIGTNVVILKGSNLSDYSVISAGSVFKDRVSTPYSFYSGIPATRQAGLPEYFEFFKRSSSHIN